MKQKQKGCLWVCRTVSSTKPVLFESLSLELLVPGIMFSSMDSCLLLSLLGACILGFWLSRVPCSVSLGAHYYTSMVLPESLKAPGRKLHIASMWRNLHWVLYGWECGGKVKSRKTYNYYIILLPWWVVHSMHSAYVVDLHEIQEWLRTTVVLVYFCNPSTGRYIQENQDCSWSSSST